MDYHNIKKQALSFITAHPSYFWSALEFSMLFAAVYSIFGLATMVTGAMVTGNSFVILLEFMAAPVYAVILFAFVTFALTALLTLPYAVATGSLQQAVAPAPRRKKRTAKPRKSVPAT